MIAKLLLHLSKVFLVLSLLAGQSFAQTWQKNSVEYGHEFKGIKLSRNLVLPKQLTLSSWGRDTASLAYNDFGLRFYTGSYWKGLVDTIIKSGDTLKYKIGSQLVTVGVFGGSASPYTLQESTDHGNTTSQNIVLTNGSSQVVRMGNIGGAGGVTINLTGGDSATYLGSGVRVYQSGLPDHIVFYPSYRGVSDKFFSTGTIINGVTYDAGSNGLTDLGTITASTDSSKFATRWWVNSTFATIANNNLKMNLTDSLAMLDGRISSITLNTSGAIHTNPITFSRVGGAWSGTMSLSTQTANSVFAGPTSGSAATPTFRALVDADIPSTSKGIQWQGVDTLMAYDKARNGFHDYSDFGGNNGFGIMMPNTSFIASGGSVANTTTGWGSGVDYYQVTTHTSATGNSHLVSNKSYGLTTDWFVQNWRIQIPDLNDGTERYYMQIGFTSNLSTAIQYGVMFVYDFTGTMTGSAASANWQIMTANNNTRTWVTTATAVAADTWLNLRIIANNTAAYFYINGVQVGTTITTNLPVTTSAANIMSPTFRIVKTNGTTARTLWADYHTLDIKYSTPR